MGAWTKGRTSTTAAGRPLWQWLDNLPPKSGPWLVPPVSAEGLEGVPLLRRPVPPEEYAPEDGARTKMAGQVRWYKPIFLLLTSKDGVWTIAGSSGPS